MRNVATDATNQSLVFYAYDADGDPVSITHASDGISAGYRIDADGREGTLVELTPVARLATGVHTDGAITALGGGKHELDLPDAAQATQYSTVTAEVSATATDLVIVEKVAIGNVPSAGENADAVRLELEDELGNLDVSISSRATVDDVSPIIAFTPTINPTILDPSERHQIASTVWGFATRSLSNVSDSVGVTTLLKRITGLLQTKSESDANQETVVSRLDNIPSKDDVRQTIENSMLEAAKNIEIKIDANPQRVVLGPCKTDVHPLYRGRS